MEAKGTAAAKKTDAAALKESFEAQYDRLNAEQRKAVDTIEGPVMVIAGPGTGKTQTLSMRVANILRKTQMRPSNILCLTFSVSGATAMRDRLRELIGPDAYGVTVSTIHGFCADIISQHPALFDEWSAKNQITDVERYREMHKIIDGLLPDVVLVNPKNPYGRSRDIISRISQVKREGKTAEDLERVLVEYERVMSTKSKEGTKAHEKNLLSVRKFAEFIEVFKRYQAMMEKTQRYDYDDMILYVIRALEREEWLIAGLQERYMYILCDEFQDTNGAQYRLIELLSTYANLAHEPNLFVVGDDDQAIYRFQGANLSNLLSFHARFKNAPTIALTKSYRSTQKILDAAANLIKQNTERLVRRIDGLEKNLISALGEFGDEPTLLRPASDSSEPWLVADLCEERIKNGQLPEEIAVLTQTNSELRAYYDVLRARNIPVQMSGKVDLLAHPLVQQAVSILRAIHKPSDNHRLASALSCECFGCHPADLARIFSAAREAKSGLVDFLLKIQEDQASIGEIACKDLGSVVHARDILLDLNQKRDTRTIIETVERIIYDCGLLKHKDGGKLDPLDVAALQEFFNRVKNKTYENAMYSYDAWLADLEFYADPEYADIRMTYELPHLVTGGVRLMTAHQSKGLEFETVILVNFRDGHWDKRRNPSSLSLPEDLLFGWEKDQKDYEKHQDERRVAFVAMTRAKRELIFTCAKELTTGEKARSVSPSAFFAEAGKLPETDGELKDPLNASTFLLTPIRHFDSEFDAYTRDRLKTFSLSATALNHFLDDPQKFLEWDLMQIPQLFEYGIAYGNAVHWALREWGLSVQAGTPIGQEAFMAEFRKFLSEREFLTDGQLGILTHVGEQALPRYFEDVLSLPAPFIHKIEAAFTAHLDDIPLKGRIDRIDLENPASARATVIDYKTGTPKAEAEIRNGDYFRQLTFYALLLEEGKSPLEPQAFVLDFVGEREHHPIQRVFQISDQEKNDMRKIIKDVWEKVNNLDFTPL